MAKLTKPAPEPMSQCGHWYTRDAAPKHMVPMAKGGMRATTLRDARKFGLVPSVTSIFKILAKPGLERYKHMQLLMASENNPRQEHETDGEWMKRVQGFADEDVSQAALLGSKIHDALDKSFDGQECPADLAQYVEPALKWLDDKAIVMGEREIVVVKNSEGFAGRVDAIAQGKGGTNFVLDFKTRRTKPGQAILPYDGQAAQTAAYAAAYFGLDTKEDFLENRIWGANLFISTTEIGRVEAVPYSPEVMAEEYDIFLACCKLWRHQTKYDPREL